MLSEFSENTQNTRCENSQKSFPILIPHPYHSGARQNTILLIRKFLVTHFYMIFVLYCFFECCARREKPDKIFMINDCRTSFSNPHPPHPRSLVIFCVFLYHVNRLCIITLSSARTRTRLFRGGVVGVLRVFFFFLFNISLWIIQIFCLQSIVKNGFSLMLFPVSIYYTVCGLFYNISRIYLFFE